MATWFGCAPIGAVGGEGQVQPSDAYHNSANCVPGTCFLSRARVDEADLEAARVVHACRGPSAGDTVQSPQRAAAFSLATVAPSNTARNPERSRCEHAVLTKREVNRQRNDPQRRSRMTNESHSRGYAAGASLRARRRSGCAEESEILTPGADAAQGGEMVIPGTDAMLLYFSAPPRIRHRNGARFRCLSTQLHCSSRAWLAPSRLAVLAITSLNSSGFNGIASTKQ